MNLNQVTIKSYDLEISKTFYQKMGFTLIVDTPHYLRFHCPQGDATFSLSLASKDTPLDPNGVSIYFEFPDAEQLDKKVDEMLQVGFEFMSMPQDERWLWREACLLDPMGYEIILYHAGENRVNPPWRV